MCAPLRRLVHSLRIPERASLLFSQPLFKSPEEIRRRHAERSRQTHDSSGAMDFCAAFQLADIRGVVTAVERKRLLRGTPRLSDLSQGQTEQLLGRFRALVPPATPLHAQTNTVTIQTIVTRDYSTDSRQCYPQGGAQSPRKEG
jgi:hypothetical protein